MDDFNYRIIQLANNKGTVLVDAEDYEEINSYNQSITSQGYAKRYATKSDRIKGSGGTIRMHRQIMGIEYLNGSIKVDHINGNKLDNRKSHLRICTHQENGRNRGYNKNSKSGIKGVSWHKGAKKWMANIFHNGKTVYIGLFSDKNDATKARKEKEQELGWMPATNMADALVIK